MPCKGRGKSSYLGALLFLSLIVIAIVFSFHKIKERHSQYKSKSYLESEEAVLYSANDLKAFRIQNKETQSNQNSRYSKPESSVQIKILAEETVEKLDSDESNFSLGIQKIVLTDSEVFSIPWNESLIESKPELVFEEDRFKGVRLNEILPGSIFEKIGLQSGDLICGMQRKNFTNPLDATFNIGAFLMGVNSQKLWFESNLQFGEIEIQQVRSPDFTDIPQSDLKLMVEIWNKDWDNLKAAKFLSEFSRGINIKTRNTLLDIRQIVKEHKVEVNKVAPQVDRFFEEFFQTVS